MCTFTNYQGSENKMNPLKQEHELPYAVPTTYNINGAIFCLLMRKKFLAGVTGQDTYIQCKICGGCTGAEDARGSNSCHTFRILCFNISMRANTKELVQQFATCWFGPRFELQLGQEILSSPYLSRPTLGPTQPPLQ